MREERRVSVTCHHRRHHASAKEARYLSLGGLRVLSGRGGVLGAVRLLLAVLLGALGLDVLVVDSHGLVDLGAEGLLVLSKAEELGVLHLEEHTGDLASELGLLSVDLGVKSLTEHLLLLVGRSGVKNVGVDGRAGRLATVLGTATLLVRATTHGATTSTLEATASTAHLRGHTGHARHHRHGAATAGATSTTHGSGLLLSSGLDHLGVDGGVAEGLGTEASGDLGRNAVGHLGHATGTTTSTLLRHTGEATTATGALHEGTATTTSGHHHRLAVGTHEDLGLHELGRHATDGALLLHAGLVASLDGSLELALADLLTLGESNVERLVVNHLLVQLGDSLGGLVGVGEADETEALASAEKLLLAANGSGVHLLGEVVNVVSALLLSLSLVLLLLLLLLLLGLAFLLLALLLVITLLLGRGLVAVQRLGVAHDLGGGDGTVRLEDLAELLVVDVVGKVLDVKVDTLVLGALLLASGLVLLAELLLALVLLLGTADVELLALEVGVVQLLNSLVGVLVVDVVDETETAALTSLVVVSERGRGDISVLLEQDAELVVGGLELDVLDVDVGEVGLHLLELAHAVLLGDVVADEDLLLVQEHAVDHLDGLVGGLGGLVVDETVALGVGVLVLGDLAAENVAEGSKGVVKGLVVNGGVEVLDEDVALASLAQSRITLRPHDAAGLALNESVVQLLESTLTVGGVVVVDVGVAERATGDGITADADRGNLADRGEQLEKHGLSDGRVELADVQRGGVGVSRLGSRLGLAVVVGGGVLSTVGGGSLSLGGGGLAGGRGGGVLNVRHGCREVLQRALVLDAS